MFYSIPSSADEVITVTPHNVRSIRYLFFENKNDKIFHYGGKLDTVSIAIDGKQIAQELPICPFCTTTPYGAGRFDWQKCALEVNLNVDNSEIKISGTVNNEYNIVFVCSDEQVDESGGFDFVEFKEFTIKTTPSTEEMTERILNIIASQYDDIREKLADFNLASDALVATLFEGATYENGRLNGVTVSLTKQEAVSLGIADIEAPTFEDWGNAADETRENLLLALTKKVLNNSAITFNTNVLEKEQNINLDHEPEKMVVFNYTSPILTEGAKTRGEIEPMQICNINLAALLETGDNQELPKGFDLGIVSITNRIPYADAVYEFQQKTLKNIKATCEICGNEDLLKAGNGVSIANWKLAMIFIYKKLA